MSAHHCHARGCSVACKPEHLMCLAHWRQVPRLLQARVYDTYRPGQCDDKRPSREWFIAADAAIGYVAWLEGLAVRVVEATAIQTLGFKLPDRARVEL